MLREGQTGAVGVLPGVQRRYLILRKSAKLPAFDERLVNYGYNKVQWLEHLRYVGYRYSILSNGYSVDIPHPP